MAHNYKELAEVHHVLVQLLLHLGRNVLAVVAEHVQVELYHLSVDHHVLPDEVAVGDEALEDEVGSKDTYLVRRSHEYPEGEAHLNENHYYYFESDGVSLL